MRLATLALLALLAAATTPAEGQIYRIQTRVSRTAVWVGDQFDYVVRAEHAPGMEFVLDHLKKEEMNLHPFEIVSVNTSTGPAAGGRRFFELRLKLAIYDAAQQDAAIPGFSLFYFRSASGAAAGSGKEETPAEVLAVPAYPVSVRSTLPDNASAIRDQRDPLPMSERASSFPGALGLLGIAVVLALGIRVAMAQIRSGAWQRRQAQRARRQSCSDSLQEIRHASGDSPEEVQAFYEKAAAILRGLAAEKLGDGAGLTGPEMEAALKKAGAGERQAAAMGRLLEQCDLIRYAPDGLETGRRVRAEFLSKFDELAEHHF